MDVVDVDLGMVFHVGLQDRAGELEGRLPDLGPSLRVVLPLRHVVGGVDLGDATLLGLEGLAPDSPRPLEIAE